MTPADVSFFALLVRSRGCVLCVLVLLCFVGPISFVVSVRAQAQEDSLPGRLILGIALLVCSRTLCPCALLWFCADQF